MTGRKPQWSRLALLLAGFLVLLGAGCATTDSDRQSDMPWNVPQAWEGSPAIPGFSQ